MSLGQERVPLIGWQSLTLVTPVAARAPAGPAVEEGAGVPRVMQHLQHPRMDERSPDQFAFAEPAPQPPWEQQALFPEVLDRRRARAGALKGGEQDPQRILDLAIRIQDDLALRVVDQADGQRRLEFSPPGLAQDAAAEPRPQDVQLGLRDRPLQTQQQAI